MQPASIEVKYAITTLSPNLSFNEQKLILKDEIFDDKSLESFQEVVRNLEKILTPIPTKLVKNP